MTQQVSGVDVKKRNGKYYVVWVEVVNHDTSASAERQWKDHGMDKIAGPLKATTRHAREIGPFDRYIEAVAAADKVGAA